MAKPQPKRRGRKKIQKMEVAEGYIPDYKNYKELRRFLTSRGKIVARNRSGLSQKMQKRLAKEIKRARHLALLPFVSVFK